MTKTNLTIELLQTEANKFTTSESSHDEPSLFGVTDGKVVGTYLEHKFQKYLHENYVYIEGSSAKGLDFPELGVDLKLNIHHTVFVEKHRTADFQTTSGLRKIIENNGNQDDIIAFFEERLLPVDEIQAQELAEEILQKPPELGYLTISNALQWRLQYTKHYYRADMWLREFRQIL